MQPKLETRAKVRVGEKIGTRPASTDYFICPDEEFARLCGDKPKAIRIEFPYSEAADNWNAGLEWWTKVRGGASKLACYTKDGGDKPVAERMEPFFSEEKWEEVVGPMHGDNRLPILCPARSCPQQEAGVCKPMGRLVFFLDGGRRDEALQIDTKSWYSCEELTKAMDAAMRRKPNLVGRTFELSVEMKTKGTSRFPVLYLKEINVEVNTASDVELADALVTLGNNPTRAGLAAYLDAARPGWREKEEFTARIREVGVDEAIKSILERAA
jgi:hypothetical protein